MELRLQFKKEGSLKFISHLDLMRLLTRAFRRASLPVAFSEGYNPKPRISMGPPLPVGVSGLKEYFDLELSERVEAEEVKTALNRVLPRGMEISRVKEIKKKVQSLTAVINRASYRFVFPGGDIQATDLEDGFSRLFSLEKWTIERKRNKKKNRMLNIKPLVMELDWSLTGERIFIDALVMTGSQGNVRAGEVILLLSREIGVHPIPLTMVDRLALYVAEEDAEGSESLIDPLSLVQ